MWTYSTINLVVTFAVFGAGVLGFVGGWLAHRAAARERAATGAAERQIPRPR